MPSETPWFQTARRWGRIAIRETEIARVDVEQWADLWSRSRLDGVTIDAGGYFATYTTRIPLHRRAPGVDSRDLFGELAKAARGLGMRVVAGIDPHRAAPEVYFARPDGFFLGADGEPRLAGDGSYFTCINTPYYWEHLPQIFAEVMERYDVDGFWGESWQGYGLLGTAVEPCHCAACAEKYRLQQSTDLPGGADRSDPGYREWLAWRYRCLGDVWAHWDDTLKLFKRGITWIGHPTLAELTERADLLTAPSLADGEPLWAAGEQGRLMRSLALGGKRRFQVFSTSAEGRLCARPAAELRLLMAEAVASGSVPCFQFPTAAPEDHRACEPIASFYAWHAEHESDLCPEEDRESAASVAVIVSERTRRYYGGDGEAARGMMAALIRAGIPFDLVPDERISSKTLSRYRAVVLPNVACLDAETCDTLWEFGSDGGGIVATFETSAYDEWGVPRGDFGMTDRLGVKLMRPAPVGPLGAGSQFRIRAGHEALADAFSGTTLLPGGGRYLCVELLMDHKAPLAVSACEPLNAAWAIPAAAEAPALILGPSGKGRIAYFPTEPDRLFQRERRADHAKLLEAAVRWAHKSPMPVELDGAGWVDVHAYRQGPDLIVHLVSMNGWGIADGRCDGGAPMMPQRLTVRAGGPYRRAELLRSGPTVKVETVGDATFVDLPEIGGDEVVALRADSSH